MVLPSPQCLRARILWSHSRNVMHLLRERYVRLTGRRPPELDLLTDLGRMLGLMVWTRELSLDRWTGKMLEEM